VSKGQTIGYDRTYTAKKNMKVGVVALGYADGVCRGLSNKFEFIVNGKKCPIVGLICMDVCMVDLENSGAKVGSEVLILGKDKNNNISLQEYAMALKTSPYEVLCAFKHNRMNYIVKNK
jgi:alanine racemase